MKEFNLERALAGDPVVTRTNIPITEIIKVNTIADEYNILAVINGAGIFFNEKGVFNYGFTDVWDLFMAPAKKQEWGYVWKHINGGGYTLAYSFNSEAEAVKHGKTSDDREVIKVFLIREWEE